jgi:glycerophosphoryl diester phosphodiesterase
MADATPGSSALELVAHRGANRRHTENTLAAFRAALDEGATAIELDVHATSDGVVVVHHDADALDFDRSQTLRLSDVPWSRVSAARIAGDERIPRLSDVLDMATGRARVYVEIKGKRIEQLVVNAIRASQADCAIHSFDHAAIASVRDIAPDIPRGLLFDTGDPAVQRAVELLARHDARDLWPHRSLVDRALVEAVQEAGKRIVVWTVNAAADARRLSAFGVDALCSDDLPAIRRALA